jgi:Hypoxia induced protein conserved region
VSEVSPRLASASAVAYIEWVERCAWHDVALGRVPDAQRKAGHIMTLLTTLLLIAMLATLAVLAVGLAGFFHGGEFNRKYGNKLMQARVALQAIAIALLLVILLTAVH